MQNATNFNDVAIVSIKGNDCRIHFWYMSKDDATNKMDMSDLKRRWIIIDFFIYEKDEWNNLLSKKKRNDVK